MNGKLEKENNGQNQQEINKLLKQFELDLKVLKYFYHGYYEKSIEHYDMIQDVNSLDVISIYNVGVSFAKHNLLNQPMRSINSNNLL